MYARAGTMLVSVARPCAIIILSGDEMDGVT